MIYARFFVYGVTVYAVFAICILVPASGVFVLGLVGGCLFSLSCWAVLLLKKIFKELYHQ